VRAPRWAGLYQVVPVVGNTNSLQSLISQESLRLNSGVVGIVLRQAWGIPDSMKKSLRNRPNRVESGAGRWSLPVRGSLAELQLGAKRVRPVRSRIGVTSWRAGYLLASSLVATPAMGDEDYEDQPLELEHGKPCSGQRRRQRTHPHSARCDAAPPREASRADAAAFITTVNRSH
jgi:hypothetical protein